MPGTSFGGQKGVSKSRMKAPQPNGEAESPGYLREDLLSMRKTDLVDLAGDLGIAVAPKATKAIIVDAILEV